MPQPLPVKLYRTKAFLLSQAGKPHSTSAWAAPAQPKSSEGPWTTISQAPRRAGPHGGVAKPCSTQALPAVHSDWVVARLLLLLLHSRDDVDHSLPIPRDPNFWPAMEMELPNLPALVFLVGEDRLRSVSWWETHSMKPTSSGLWESLLVKGGHSHVMEQGRMWGTRSRREAGWWAQGWGRRMKAAGWQQGRWMRSNQPDSWNGR